MTKPSFDVLTTPNFIKFTAFILLSFSLFLLLFNHLSPPSSSSSSASFAVPSSPTPSFSPHPTSPPPPSPPPPMPPSSVVETMGIVDDTGAMTGDFKVGDFSWVDDGVEQEEESRNHSSNVVRAVKVEKCKVCDERVRGYNYIPKQGMSLDCLVPIPDGYKISIPWPQSRDEVWLSNLPQTHLAEAEDSKNAVAIKGDKYVFPNAGMEEYLERISQMMPDIAFGRQIRIALDINSGVGKFGSFLMQFNVITLSIAPKYDHSNQIQFALERGLPAMLTELATHRLLYPSQAFDLIHCSNCGTNWTRDDGVLLLEANRILRAGGYFVWATQSEKHVQEQWKDMEDLATRICWEVVRNDRSVGIWRKPLNNSCYQNRDAGMQPPICDSSNGPDNVWFVGLTACISQLPESGYGANVTRWPARLHDPPDRLLSIDLDAYISRKDIFRAESKYWNDIVDSFVRAFHWKEYNFRNVLDMRAGFGGFAAALHDLQIDCWVMNVVPVNGFNTLPVIFDRGLIGVMHDWCEPFDTYPRTYDLLHAAGLFSVEHKRQRCNISTIMLEMDRMLRPGGRVYIRDSISVIGELQELANAMGWIPALHDTSEGPHASWQILICEKRM